MQALLWILGGLVVGVALLLLDEYFHERQWDRHRRKPRVWQMQQAVMRQRKREVMREMHRIIREHRR